MAFGNFPKLKGPPPIIWAFLMLGWSQGILFLDLGATGFLGINLLNVSLILLTIALGQKVVPRFEQNFILISCLFLILGLYGFYRGFDKAEVYILQIGEVFPALVLLFSLRLYRTHYAVKKALEIAGGLIPEEKIGFADQARTTYKKYPGALHAAAEIYKEVAEEGLARYDRVLPIHIVAMQKYGHMLIYDEARGRSGEGEWYAKRAHELSLALLRDSDIPPTIH